MGLVSSSVDTLCHRGPTLVGIKPYLLVIMPPPSALQVSTEDGVLVARHDLTLDSSTDVADHPEFADRRCAAQPLRPTYCLRS